MAVANCYTCIDIEMNVVGAIIKLYGVRDSFVILPHILNRYRKVVLTPDTLLPRTCVVMNIFVVIPFGPVTQHPDKPELHNRTKTEPKQC